MGKILERNFNAIAIDVVSNQQAQQDIFLMVLSGMDPLTKALTPVVQEVIKFVDLVYQANCVRRELPRTEFYNHPICDYVQPKSEMRTWTENKRMQGRGWHDRRFTLIDYPWILDCAFKAKLLEFESADEKEYEMRKAMHTPNMMRSLMHGQFDALFFTIEVRRANIIGDTLMRLQNSEVNFKKQMKVRSEHV